MRFGRLWADYAQTTDEQVIVEFLKNKEDFEFFRIINRYEKVLGRGISVVGMMILAAIRAGALRRRSTKSSGRCLRRSLGSASGWSSASSKRTTSSR